MTVIIRDSVSFNEWAMEQEVHQEADEQRQVERHRGQVDGVPLDVNFTNILEAACFPISFQQKITNTDCK